MKIYSFTREIDRSTEYYMSKAAAQLALIKEATTGFHQLPADELKDCLISLFENGDDYIVDIGWIEEDERYKKKSLVM